MWISPWIDGPIFFLLTPLFTWSGALLYRLALPSGKSHVLAMQLGGGTTLSLLFFLFCYLLLIPYISPVAALLSGVVPLLVLALWQRRQGEALLKGVKKAFFSQGVKQQLLGSFLLVMFWGVGFWAVAQNSEQVHRSTPQLLQSYPLLVLLILATCSQLFGLLRWFGIKGRRQWMGLAVVLGGQSALSALPIVLSGDQIALFSVYESTVWLAVSGSILLLLHLNGTLRAGESLSPTRFILPLGIGLFWAVWLPMMGWLFLPGIILFMAWMQFRIGWPKRYTIYFGMPLMTLLMLSFWVQAPPLFIQVGWVSQQSVMGVGHTPLPVEQLQQTWQFGQAQGALYHLEHQAWMGVKALFYPLVGMILMTVWVLTGQEHALGPPAEGRLLGAREGPFVVLSLGLFLTAYLMVLLTQGADGKEILALWLRPGVVLGLLFLVVGLKRFLAALQGWHREMMWGLLMVVTLFGPLSNLLALLYDRLVS
ncbi:hypothetical protein [Magnetococcus sp. PR-3]|uniref:hypothetical protein n=1 Tax=Magnetococcus sp. PR-3 TaxID=3120355 RepID=UPI002FCE1B95